MDSQEGVSQRSLAIGGIALVALVGDAIVLGADAIGVITVSALMGGLVFAFSAIGGFQGGGCFMAIVILGAIGMVSSHTTFNSPQIASIGTMIAMSVAGYVLGGLRHRTSALAKRQKASWCPHCKERVQAGATRCPHCTSSLS